MNAGWTSVPRCWICDGGSLARVHDAVFELSTYRDQDPDLAAYSGERIEIVCCRSCGFAQPGVLPALPRYFDRMYDQRWSPDWIVREHEAPYKDLIFDDVLRALAARTAARSRRLLDVGAHAGRFVAVARRAGWDAEGLELNPSTAAYAAAASGGAVHHGNVDSFQVNGRGFDAVVLTDVLEHVPEPRTVLRRVRDFIVPGGWISIKVPNAPAQRLKETVKARLRPGYRASVADNLVHVNHFSPGSLQLALVREGYSDVSVLPAAPELPPREGRRGEIVVRRAAFAVARAVPGGVHTPLAFNLQAYARRR
jgi:SAM-dependent methyltransferase